MFKSMNVSLNLLSISCNRRDRGTVGYTVMLRPKPGAVAFHHLREGWMVVIRLYQLQLHLIGQYLARADHESVFGVCEQMVSGHRCVHIVVGVTSALFVY